MASCVGPRFDAVQMHAEIPKGKIAHLDNESGLSGKTRLLERDSTAERCLNGETHPVFNRSEYESLEFGVNSP